MPHKTMQKHLVNVGPKRKTCWKWLIQIAHVLAFTLNIFTAKVSGQMLGKVLHELISDLLERLRSSCLSATVDLSSSSHISALIRWEFLITIGTSSNIFSKPMPAFFKLKSEGQKKIDWATVCLHSKDTEMLLKITNTIFYYYLITFHFYILLHTTKSAHISPDTVKDQECLLYAL